MTLYEHITHPHVEARKDAGPVKVANQHAQGNLAARFNARLAVWVTRLVGSMWCAYAFAALAVAGLPTALEPGNIGFLFWFSSDLLQLTLLSVIIVGQNIQAGAADKRAEQTYLDAEAVLHGQEQQAAHLAAQDAAILAIQSHLEAQDAKLSGLIGQVSALLAATARTATPEA